ncbi:hypothetical protein RRU01S_07_02460 [Agrobacterium rubi TR3 = NBRC 13261]|uniref:Uncharacterized protein n=1 Tax=Agrobacterium rubi TR3 = NBRC 13261 TaxID=1368415 RepID=A0A081CSS5_9HYPH|nr:hypothetical protein RRU01S_07_02460 [Agrobacterium rubi TR3 = NBRC 13261]
MDLRCVLPMDTFLFIGSVRISRYSIGIIQFIESSCGAGYVLSICSSVKDVDAYEKGKVRTESHD